VSKPEAKASATHRAGRKGKDQRQAAFALAPDEKTPGKNVARKKKDRAPTPRSHPAATDAAAPSAQVAGPGKQENASQKAEAAYRRALASAQEGYLNEAIGLLEQALQANARHEAARQTLIGLLIENKRSDEAMRQLQLGLTLDPKQPAMAMLLARLQIEHGGSGIETLTRTLPYAGSNGEYHAFLAGALQRQQRHREAAEQYQTALQGAPQNGVWCMGLGISLQAEKRDAEALDAFRKAKASGMLAPQLLSFVDSKIKQLAR
jgi:MSHA biogenesis protein MshN